MAQPMLRIYYGPEKSVTATVPERDEPRVDRVTVQLSDVFPLLADAVRDERTWLRDFAEDEITISSDLYEVLLAYQHYCRRPSA
jgi:hypothetical protein